VKKGDFIFVYGTLRRGQRADLQKQQHNFGVTFCGEDRINGLMYHLGAYPGLKLLSERVFTPEFPVICGELFRIRETAMVAIMDAYEGYDADNPSQGLYNRHQVVTEGGRTAWVYCYNFPVTSDQLIESGDWVKNPDPIVRERRLRT
jgi:gamma-glutamylcyclotransferase (GGCT)/AIG2-like uncharacterized protein YtfP